MAVMRKPRAAEATPGLTAKDVKVIVGVSRKSIHDWDRKGLLPANRKRGRGWRRFGARELFALMVVAAIREEFGIPLERLAGLARWLRRRGHADPFLRAWMMNHFGGVNACLVTDLQKTFKIQSEKEELPPGGDALLVFKVTPILMRVHEVPLFEMLERELLVAAAVISES